jgi:hypothetical protein
MFDVERSEDGSNFMSVARQQGGAGKENYQYAEPRGTGWRYYRIKAVDQYGLTQYSNIVSMAPANVAALQLSNVFPNPAKDQVNITVNSPGDENIRMELYAVSGQKLRDVVQQIGRGTQNISLGLAGVNVGNYLLTITIKGQRYSYVVIKQ